MMNSDAQCPYCGAGPHEAMFETRTQRRLAVGVVALLVAGIAALIAAISAS